MGIGIVLENFVIIMGQLLRQLEQLQKNDVLFKLGKSVDLS